MFKVLPHANFIIPMQKTNDTLHIVTMILQCQQHQFWRLSVYLKKNYLKKENLKVYMLYVLMFHTLMILFCYHHHGEDDSCWMTVLILCHYAASGIPLGPTLFISYIEGTTPIFPHILCNIICLQTIPDHRPVAAVPSLLTRLSSYVARPLLLFDCSSIQPKLSSTCLAHVAIWQNCRMNAVPWLSVRRLFTVLMLYEILGVLLDSEMSRQRHCDY